VRLHNGALVIPLRDGNNLHSLQFIDADGQKRFLTDGRVAGSYFAIGDPKGAAALCIAEGYATGATIFEATNYPVAVAFNAGNLEPVARALRAKIPEMDMIV
jgi:putative DNA primase/helicase